MPNGHTQKRIENYAAGPISVDARTQRSKLLERLF